MAKIPDEDEQKIVALLIEGKTCREVGKAVGRSNSTVSQVARRNGLDLVELARDRLKRAELVGKYRTAERRASVAAKIVEKGEEFLAGADSARDFKDVSIGLAVGLDKLRLELPSEDDHRGGEIRALFERMGEEEAGL